jgi:hypothetical protein
MPAFGHQQERQPASAVLTLFKPCLSAEVKTYSLNFQPLDKGDLILPYKIMNFVDEIRIMESRRETNARTSNTQSPVKGITLGDS